MPQTRNTILNLLRTALLGMLVSSPFGFAAEVSAQEPALVKFEVSPPNVKLNTKVDLQTLIVQGFFSDGTTRDLTGQVKFIPTNPALIKIEGAKITPVADGATDLKVEFGGQAVMIPVMVKDAAADRPISFKMDVMPVFTKMGCNTGSCHGAARGKDGFRLSLFGFDSDGDYQRITRQINGRRIDLGLPHESLMLEKGAGKVPHTGGSRFKIGDEYYNTLYRWIEAGAPPDQGVLPKPIAVELYPKTAVLDGKGATQQMTVRAIYSDGTDRDVTSLAFFMTNNETSAAVTPAGTITANERGEAFILARFESISVGSHLIVLPKGLKFEFPKVAENNYIDGLIHNKLQKLRVAPSELCTDEVFLRRVFLDIVGVLPTPEEYNRFMTRAEPNKRDLLVDELLGRKEFVEMWVMKWAELLQIRTSQQVSYKSMLLYFNWLQERIANNVPMDKMVQELLAAKGGTFTSPATNYYQNESDMLKVTENVAQVFMGMRIQCAQCHNHPFDRWTMDDYYGFAAFFSQIGRKQAEDPREIIVFNSGGGEVAHPVGGRVMKPKFLGGVEPDVAGKDRREIMANWLASKENPYFATNLANIVWAHFFGRGIIHDVDDVRVSNPAANPELIEELGKRFTSYNYDFKKLVRDICTSRTYQLATKPNESNGGDTKNFSHASVRRIRAEILLDCITGVTDTKNKFGGLPLGARAVQIADGNTSSYFLSTFGRATRETVCSCEVKMEPNLSQALHLMNGETVIQKIQQGQLIDRRLQEKKTPPEILDEMYVRCFSRKATPEELAKLNELVNAEPDKKKILEDIFWALLNSREFLFNH